MSISNVWNLGVHMPKRGFFGIGIYNPKTETNVGTLWRSAHNFGAAFIFTIGKRYRREPSDTTKAWRSIPLLTFDTVTDFRIHIPLDTRIIGIEQTPRSRPLANWIHPDRVIYLLGAEDFGLPSDVLDLCNAVVAIESPMCFNVAAAGSIVMYDRAVKQHDRFLDHD